MLQTAPRTGSDVRTSDVPATSRDLRSVPRGTSNVCKLSDVGSGAVNVCTVRRWLVQASDGTDRLNVDEGRRILGADGDDDDDDDDDRPVFASGDDRVLPPEEQSARLMIGAKASKSPLDDRRRRTVNGVRVRRPIQTVLVVVRLENDDVANSFLLLISWLVKDKLLSVYVDETIANDRAINQDFRFSEVKERVMCFNSDAIGELSHTIDLVLCLGGDGSLLSTSALFQKRVPPVMAFSVGCSGFLTTLDFCDFAETIDKHIREDTAPYFMKRSRLDCVLTRKDSCSKPCVRTVVLNDVVVDRGVTSFLCSLDVYVDSFLVTTVHGDGLLLSTPTGSTAYAASAGASIVHPNVPAILIIPICPHTLSFRPIIVPADVEITVKLSPSARNEAWISFDGCRRTQLRQGDRLTVTTSAYPMPVVCAGNPTTDWFDSLGHTLHWNVRRQQKPLTPC